MEAIRVYVVDDHPMIRHGLAAMLAGENDVRCVGDAGDGLEAVRAAPTLKPDVVLMDLAMPRMDGVATIVALRRLLPHTHFVVLAGALQPGEVRRAVAAGASGFLLKSASTLELVNVIRAAHRGQSTMSAAISDALAQDDATSLGSDLTQRERELLALMARGLSNQEISQQLTIAMPTVKFHVTNILAKLHADNRTEAVLVALKHKLVALE